MRCTHLPGHRDLLLVLPSLWNLPFVFVVKGDAHSGLGNTRLPLLVQPCEHCRSMGWGAILRSFICHLTAFSYLSILCSQTCFVTIARGAPRPAHFPRTGHEFYPAAPYSVDESWRVRTNCTNSSLDPFHEIAVYARIRFSTGSVHQHLVVMVHLI